MSNSTAVVVTNKGTIELEIDEEWAPGTAANFIELVNKGFYNGLTFHRYEPGFVIQGGDPVGNGTGGSGKQIKLELSGKNRHDVAGTLAMARSSDPHSASCQFYITLAPAAFLDGSYATFGKVTSGMEVVQSLRAGDVMTSVSINPVE